MIGAFVCGMGVGLALAWFRGLYLQRQLRAARLDLTEALEASEKEEK